MDRAELINRAKELLASGALSKEACDAIKADFPELADSEDERIRKHLVEIVEMYWGKTNDPDKAKDLAYLEKQKEQKPADIPSSGSGAMGTTPPAYKLDVKPAEWSEEDERIMDNCIEYIKASCLDAHDFNECIAWLKSLRPKPHWKPSEEQMNMLLAIVNDPNNAGAESCHLAMQSLYNDLKKLM